MNPFFPFPSAVETEIHRQARQGLFLRHLLNLADIQGVTIPTSNQRYFQKLLPRYTANRRENGKTKMNQITALIEDTLSTYTDLIQIAASVDSSIPRKDGNDKEGVCPLCHPRERILETATPYLRHTHERKSRQKKRLSEVTWDIKNKGGQPLARFERGKVFTILYGFNGRVIGRMENTSQRVTDGQGRFFWYGEGSLSSLAFSTP